MSLCSSTLAATPHSSMIVVPLLHDTTIMEEWGLSVHTRTDTVTNPPLALVLAESSIRGTRTRFTL